MRSPFILASGSQIRRKLLSQAGVDFIVMPSDVDEDVIKTGNPDWDADALALNLAEAKALDVSDKSPGALVLGADQVLSLDGQTHDKARSKDEARQRLIDLRGKTHRLHASLALAKDNKIVWRFSQSSVLTVRNFSHEFLDAYLDSAGDALTASVGCYAYEDLGAQLFERVDGEYFAILGLPLLPLLAELRARGVVMA